MSEHMISHDCPSVIDFHYRHGEEDEGLAHLQEAMDKLDGLRMPTVAARLIVLEEEADALAKALERLIAAVGRPNDPDVWQARNVLNARRQRRGGT